MLPSPIQTMIEQSGECAKIITPQTSTAADYDPASTQDFAPTSPPIEVDVELMIATKDMKIGGLPQGATAAVTIQATTKPRGLTASLSTLVWNDATYLIVDYRERRFQGKLDGYTLYIKA